MAREKEKHFLKWPSGKIVICQQDREFESRIYAGECVKVKAGEKVQLFQEVEAGYYSAILLKPKGRTSFYVNPHQEDAFISEDETTEEVNSDIV